MESNLDISVKNVKNAKFYRLNSNVTRWEWCPGNGTRYEIAVAKVYGANFGTLGSVDVGYLVVEGLYRRAYLLQAVGDLHPSYIKEKFNLVYDEDVKYVTKLIAYALNRPYIGK